MSFANFILLVFLILSFYFANWLIVIVTNGSEKGSVLGYKAAVFIDCVFISMLITYLLIVSGVI